MSKKILKFDVTCDLSHRQLVLEWLRNVFVDLSILHIRSKTTLCWLEFMKHAPIYFVYTRHESSRHPGMVWESITTPIVLSETGHRFRKRLLQIK
jgi:hypothetical protein